MHRDELVAGFVVPRRAEHVATRENSLLLPPEHDLPPMTACADHTEGERSERLARHHMVRHTELLRERSTVAIVAVEQLDDARRLARGAPAGLRLDDVAPQRDLAENAADRAGLVASAGVRERIHRIARGVEAAVAGNARNRMRRERFGEGIFVPAALGERGLLERPDEVVQDRSKPETRSGLRHGPSTPAGDDLGTLANSVSGLHQRAPAKRTAAGGITPSTSP